MDAATRNHIRFRRSEIVRERTKPRQGPQPPTTHEQMVAEVESAIAVFQSAADKAARRRERYAEVHSGRRKERWREEQAAKRSLFPPFCKVPPVALSAVVTS